MGSKDALMATYNRLPVEFTHGEGAWLTDTAGRRYLDAIAGIAVCGLGHNHPAVTEAISRQAARVIHTSNLFMVGKQRELAERLCADARMDRVFFGNSGAEANEAAIKLARLHAHHQEKKKASIVVMENAFHGRTLATLSATGNRKIQKGFEPLVSGFVRAPYGDAEALHTIARNNPHVVAVLVEPIQGEAGVIVPPDGYLRDLRQLCDQYGWLLMLDEIQTGMGRTGHLFAFQSEGILPDVVTLAKGLGNGVPIGACLARGAAAEVFGPGSHGSTFGGNPLACSAGLAVLETLEQDNLPERATALGTRIVEGLRQQLDGLEQVTEIRHRGLMIGVQLSRDCGELAAKGLEAGILVNVAGGNTIRLLPPLVMTDTEADRVVELVSGLVRAFPA